MTTRPKPMKLKGMMTADEELEQNNTKSKPDPHPALDINKEIPDPEETFFEE